MEGIRFEISRSADRVAGASYLQRVIGDGLVLSVVTSIPGEPTGGFIMQWLVDEEGQGAWARLEEVPAECISLRD